MKVDGGLPGADPEEVARAARELEDVGYDGGLTAETSHDPFLPLVVAAEHTERLELGTGIAVAFARNPMNLASISNDLQALSRGRFRLGLGSQIKAHIEKRFSMPWSHPAARMRELILAIRAIWACWNDGAPLDFRGEFYRHTLMTPFFNPGPNPSGPPTIQLAAVGERMTEVAGEVADGIILHGFTTERYVREVTLPALERGFAKRGHPHEAFEVCGPLFVVTGTTDEEFDAARTATKQQIAFYGSTPAYRPVLELHGWGDLQGELNARSKRGEWVAMGDLVTDDILETFAVVAKPEDIPARMLERFGDVVDRISFYAPYRSDPDRWKGVLAGFRD
ncbi:MAG TPA: LLM class F420-dependent oxidoreductase [Acidimicrobiia bacterium]|nr:LLM class F420-dependent oxidoreductase [Acidimicrobiia bacterium]